MTGQGGQAMLELGQSVRTNVRDERSVRVHR